MNVGENQQYTLKYIQIGDQNQFAHLVFVISVSLVWVDCFFLFGCADAEIRVRYHEMV